MIDSEIYVTLEQIAEHVGRSLRQLRRHSQAGWIKAVKKPGVRQLRVTLQNANKWIALHHPKSGPMKSDFQQAE